MEALIARADYPAPIRDRAQALFARSRGRPEHRLNRTEAACLRRLGVKKADLHGVAPSDLSDGGEIPVTRARQLVGLADFSQLRSVGTEAAKDFWQLGFDCRDEIKGEHPVALWLSFSVLAGGYVDPCVEDVFRCAIAQVERPDLPSRYGDWWSWTPYRGVERLPDPRLDR